MLKSVVVLGRKIPIKYCSEARMNQWINGAVGIYDSETQSIYLLKTLNRKSMIRTLAHEIGHVVFNLTCLDNVLPLELQEIIVQTYATLIEDILDARTKIR
jgi:Zn-dependent peptidase ImmA (M78 family)